MTTPEPHIMIRWAYGGYIVDYELPAPEKVEGQEEEPKNEVSTAIFSTMPPVLKLVEKVLMQWVGPVEDIPDKVSDIVKPKRKR